MLDGTPLNVFADGLGAIQVRQDGVASGLFYDPDENPAHAGLEIKEGDTYYPLPGRFSTAPGRASTPSRSRSRRTRRRTRSCTRPTRSARTCGSARTITYTDGTSSVDHPLRHPERLRRRRLAAGGCARRPLRRRQRQRQRRDLRPGAALRGRPRRGDAGSSTACRRSPPGAPSRRATSSPSSTTSPATGLNNTVDSGAPDNGVGADFAARQPRARRDARRIDVRWLLAARAPPGTVSPPAALRPRRRRRQPRPSRRAAAARRRASPSTSASARAASSTSPAEQEVHRAQGPDADPGRRDDRHAQGPRHARSRPPTRRARPRSRGSTTASSRSARPRAPSRSPSSRWPSRSAECPKGKKASSAAAKKKTRKLWGDGKGKFRTQGNFSSATVRGTRWLVIDRCDGTLTQVAQGSVARARLQAQAQERHRPGRQAVPRAQE